MVPSGKPRSSFRSHHFGLLSLLLNNPARHNKRAEISTWSFFSGKRTPRKDASIFILTRGERTQRDLLLALERYQESSGLGHF